MAITTSEARRDLFGLIERVNLDHTEVEITSKRGSAVLMSKDEYDALVETSYLLRSPKNAQRLLSAFNAAREGKVVERNLAQDAQEDSVDVEWSPVDYVDGPKSDVVNSDDLWRRE
ncbi:type II toxin-antitoxin system prevent-host-death family antitoxin [Pseudarthrobacter phenanthrenivorans]|uniref:type II toxin-antitoxin system prevent-host-death family antitoxin n=1 Tax=Pseudarthrobacter phenanthrenivorans TaxID=361575 RepID=UPI0009DFAB23